MADNPIFVDGLDFEFAETGAVQLLQLQVNARRRSEGRAFPPPQQVTNGGHVNLIILFVGHQLLAAVFFDRKTIHNGDLLTRLLNVTAKILIVMAGGFHAHQNHLSAVGGNGRLDRLAKLVKPGAEDVDLELGMHSPSRCAAAQHGNLC